MAQPTQLNATEQDTLVKQIGLSLLRAAPRDWNRVTAEYRAVGKYHELTGEIITADGGAQEWVATHDIATLFGKLRAGMYRDGRGTWFNARYTLEHPSSYNLEYDRDEPTWDLIPPGQAYADELRIFPRSEENIPEWLMRRMSGLGPERPGPRFRIARVFDGVGAAGRPVINRPELALDEQDRLLDYLDGAPVVLPGHGHDIDRLASEPEGTVPVAFHSDGEWIWPAAVNFYLREYGVSPENDLIAHIESNGYELPEVPDPQRQAAAAYITRGDGAPPPNGARHGPDRGPGPQSSPPPQAAEETTVSPAVSRHAAPDSGSDDPAATTMTPPVAPPPQSAEPGGSSGPGIGGGLVAGAAGAAVGAGAFAASGRHEDGGRHEDTGRTDEGFQDEGFRDEGFQHDGGRQEGFRDERFGSGRGGRDDDGGPPTQWGAAPVPAHGEPALDELHDKLEELDVPESVYSIDGPNEYGWALEEVPGGWRVGWYDGALTNPAVFGDAEDAAAFMLGKVLLDPDGRTAQEQVDTPVPDAPAEQEPASQSPAPAAQPPAPPAGGRQQSPSGPPDRANVMATLSPDIATGAAFGAGAGAAGAGATAGSADSTRFEARPAPQQSAPARPPQQSGGGDVKGGQWPVQPAPGEPPLTLFRGKEMRELPAGSELDRFGGPNGNLTYVAGTPFEERSLVPEWVNRPYHVYRVQRPFQALAGIAIPWFNQPGGGAAYLLPAAIEELLADGDLIELDPGEPPID